MAVGSTSRRSVRDATRERTTRAQAEPLVSTSRTKLPLDATPSLCKQLTDRTVDADISGTKAEVRIHLYFIHALCEIFHDIPLERGRTVFQGSQAPKGWQAGHASLYPATKDTYTQSRIAYIHENGLTPEKTQPFLKQRIDPTPEEYQLLAANHKNLIFVKNFILSRLPKNGNISIFAGTRFAEICNATFENPDESNQYDSHLEKKIKPFLKELQILRLEGTDTAEDSTTKLVEWLIDYYQEGFAAIEKQKKNIETIDSTVQQMRIFEMANLGTTTLNKTNFENYLGHVTTFLRIHQEVATSQDGYPSCGALQTINREDFRNLRALNTMNLKREMESPEDREKTYIDLCKYFCNNRHRLSKMAEFEADLFFNKYKLYLDESEAQCEAMHEFSDPCAVPSLRKMLFGIMENNVRRTPTEEELKDQILSLSRVATP